MTMCWECDVDAEQTIQIGLPSQSDRVLFVFLCAACYLRCYLPLVSGQATAPAVSG